MAGDGRRNTRGIYAQLPRGAEEAVKSRLPLRLQPGAHFDTNLTDDSMTHGRFMVTALISDTPVGCPGFTLWPGSAQRLYTEALRVRWDGLQPDSDEAAQRLSALIRQIVSDTKPVAVCGPAGTIVLWHRACMHSVGANYSAVIRKAIIYGTHTHAVHSPNRSIRTFCLFPSLNVHPALPQISCLRAPCRCRP